MFIFSIHHSNTPPLLRRNIMNTNTQQNSWSQLNSIAIQEQPLDWHKRAGSLIRSIQSLNVKPKRSREVKSLKSLQTQVFTEEEDKFNFLLESTWIRCHLKEDDKKQRLLCVMFVCDWWVNLLSNLLSFNKIYTIFV